MSQLSVNDAIVQYYGSLGIAETLRLFLAKGFIAIDSVHLKGAGNGQIPSWDNALQKWVAIDPPAGGSGGVHNHDGSYAALIHTHDYAGTTHTHDYAAGVHTHDYSPTNHNHDAAYSATGHAHVHDHNAAYSAIGHSHDTSHNHDGVYSPIHTHPYSASTHDHAGVYAPVHTHPYAADLHGHTGTLDANARVGIKNNGAAALLRRSINFIPGSNVTLGITDDAANEEVDVTITAAIPGGAGGPATVKLTADLAAYSVATLVNLAGLAFAVASGVYYRFVFNVVHQQAATTTGLRLGLTFPAATIFAAHARVSHGVTVNADGTDIMFEGPITTSGDSVLGTGVQAAATNYISTIEGFILPSAAGNIQVQYAPEVAAAMTVKQGSHGLLFTL